MKKTNLRPIAFVLAATNHGGMLVNRHDYRLVGDGGYGVGYQLLNNSSFDQEEVDFALQLLNERRARFGDGVVALDCGANIGVHTVEWAQFMHGWGSVVAFEAQERVFYALAGNITLNNCFNARAIWAALGRAEGSIRVPVPDYFSPASFGSLELVKTPRTEFIGQDIDYGEARTQETRMVAIDQMALQRVDLMKIDVEGMELEVLAGARATVERHRPQLIVEKLKTQESEIQAFLAPLGYRFFPLGPNLLAIHDSDPTAALVTVR
jgi:FkbM family methyltransferase